MTRIATASAYNSVLMDLMNAQSRQSQAQAQVSSGRSASDLKGFAKDAETLTATRSVMTRVEGFMGQGEALAAKLTVQDLALTQAADAAQGARQAIGEALANGHGDVLMSELSSWFSSAADALNARHGGRYLFSGAQVDVAPVQAGAMSELTATPSVADVFANDALIPTSRLDEVTAIQSGFLADALGTDLFAAFQQVQAYVDANGPFTGELTAAQQTFLEGTLAGFDDARSGLTDAAARNGLIQNRVADTMETQSARRDMLEGMIGDAANVDMAEAISRLQQAQTAVQASAQVFTVLRASSLLDLLR